MKKKDKLTAVLWLLLLPVVALGATGRLSSDIECQIRNNYLDREHEYIVTVPTKALANIGSYDNLKVQAMGNATPRGNFMVKVYFFKNGAVFRTASVNTHIAIYQDVLIAARQIKAKEPLTPDIFAWARREVTSLRDLPVTDSVALSGMCASRVIQRGKVLQQAMLRKEEVIKRGDRVQITYRTGNLFITAGGEAKQAGAIGDLIKVKNLSSNKLIIAEVQNDKSVKILR